MTVDADAEKEPPADSRYFALSTAGYNPELDRLGLVMEIIGEMGDIEFAGFLGMLIGRDREIKRLQAEDNFSIIGGKPNG